MIYVLYFLLIAAVFGIIALIDFLFKKLLPKPKHVQKGNIVRMPRYSFILGIVIFMLAVMALLCLRDETFSRRKASNTI